MGDSIDRKTAIETVRKCAVKEVTPAYMLIDKAEVMTDLMLLPSAQPEIVRCKDCKHRGEKPIADDRYWCDIHDAFMYYCSDAERRTDEGFD